MIARFTTRAPACAALALAALCAACSGRAASPASAPHERREPPAPIEANPRAFRVERAEDLLPGPAAAGRLGDWRLDNGRVAFVVSDAPGAYGFSESGGNLMDAAPVGGVDELAQLYLYLDDTFPRQSLTREVIAPPSRDASRASLLARGVDSANPELAIETEYSLARGSDTLVMRTTIENRGAQPVAAYEIGDVISWGQAEHFAPGHGLHFRGRITVPWLAGLGERTAYGYTAAGGELGGPHGSAWSDTILTTVDLAPGAKITVERFLIVHARPDLGAVLARIQALRGEAAGAPVTGRVVEDGSGAPLAGVRVWARRGADGAPEVVTITDADGRWTLPGAPPGRRYVPEAPGRQVVAEAADPGAADGGATAAAEHTLKLSPLAELAYTIVERRADGTRAPSPGKLTFSGRDGTPDPALGPRFRAGGAGNVVLSASGAGRVALTPGRYRVTVSRGPEFDLFTAEVTVAPGAPVALAAELVRVVDTRGWLSADLHQHQLPSPDSSVSLGDRVTANLAEGVEIALATDHNQITDLGPAARALAGVAPLATLVGLEATTEHIGHFMAYPLAVRAGEPRGGAPLVNGQAPATIFARLRALAPELIVQVNHPRSGSSGYFGLAKLPADAKAALPPELDLGFDAVEVMNGKRAGDFEPVLRDWFQLVARGKVTTLVGGSDTHMIIGQECGYPRIWLEAGHDDPAQADGALLAGAVRRRAIIVSNGPFLRVEHGGQSVVGQTVTLKDARARAEVVVTVDAAPWVDVTRLEVWHAGRIVETLPLGRAAGATRATAVVKLGAAHAGAVVFVVRGDRSLAPVVPDEGAAGVTPLAVANPVFVELSGRR